MSNLSVRIGAFGRGLMADIRANKRLATLLLMIPGVLVVHLALLTGDSIAAARADHATLARRADRLESLASGGDWSEQIHRERQRLALWEMQVWRAASPELAAADLQTVLQRLSAEHLAWNRLKLSPAEPVAGIGGWRIKAELNGKLKEQGALPLLQDLAEHNPRIRIDQLNASQQRGQTVGIQLSVLVSAADSAP